jgi:hypothetical protein
LRKQRELEARIESSGNGYALVRLLDVRMRRDRALEAERLRLDATVSRLMDWRAEETELLERLRDERRTAEAEVAGLEQREALLRAAVAASQAELVERLRELHDGGGLEPVLRALPDVFEEVDE